MESWGPSSIWALIEGKTEREIKRERNSGVREFGCVGVEGVCWHIVFLSVRHFTTRTLQLRTIVVCLSSGLP